MKLKLLLFALVLMTPLAFAISEGQIITQAQLDGTDIDSIDFECRYETGSLAWKMDRDDDGNLLSKIPLGIEAEFSCLDIRYRGNDLDDYEVFRHPIDSLYKTKRLLECKGTTGSIASCKADIIAYFKQDVRAFAGTIKKIAKSYQTTSLDDLNFEDEL